MNGQQAVRLIDRLLDREQQRKLNDLQSTIVLQIWEGNTYRSIADRLSYDLDYIKQIAARLWKLFSPLLNESICKSNIQSVLERYYESMSASDRDALSEGTEPNLQPIETWMTRNFPQEQLCQGMTTIAFFSSRETTKLPQPMKLDLQIQGEIKDLISQNFHKPLTPSILMDEILSVLAVKNPDRNSVNCVVINCYFDRQSRYELIC